MGMRAGSRWRVINRSVPAVLGVLFAVTLLVDAAPPAAATTATACPPRSLPATDFEDTGGVHGDAARCLWWYGLTNGRTSERFGVADRVTRGQLASLVVRTIEAAGGSLPETQERAFDDTHGSPHEQPLEQLAAAGIIRGTAPRRAEPGAAVRRGQVATILVGAVEHLEGATLPRGRDAFNDDDGSVHEDAINAAAAARLVRGVGDRRFQPGSAMTRGQIATVLARALERFVLDERMEPPPQPEPRWEVSTLPADVREQMRGVSWEPDCPVGLDELHLVVLTHRGFDGRLHRGELVVHRTVAEDLGTVFTRLQRADVPLQRVERIEHYDGSDERSMAANNTSAFNCRLTTSGSRFSEHAYGTAVDLNPIQNPYVRGSTVLPEAGRDYLDRSDVRRGMIVEGDVTVRAFDDIGWGWGGRWESVRDYMHFSASGR
jgi:hypothetical protein